MRECTTLAQECQHTGYVPIHDLPESGAFASLFLAELQSRQGVSPCDLTIWAASIGVSHRAGQGSYSQFAALRDARQTLSSWGRVIPRGSGVPTMFGKTVSVFACHCGANSLGLLELPDALKRVPHVRYRITCDPTSPPPTLARELMFGGWVAAVASGVARKVGQRTSGAEEVIEDALHAASRVGEAETLEVLKAFAAPTWRTNPYELLHLPDPSRATQQDLHFPELLPERVVETEYEQRARNEGAFLVVTDTDGLFHGSAGDNWGGLVAPLRELSTAHVAGHMTVSDFLDQAFEVRLSVARRLRSALIEVANLDGLESPIYARGDGLLAFTRDIDAVTNDLSRFAQRSGRLLPFTLGAAPILRGMPFALAIERAETALVAARSTVVEFGPRFYVYGESMATSRRKALIDGLAASALPWTSEQGGKRRQEFLDYEPALRSLLD